MNEARVSRLIGESEKYDRDDLIVMLLFRCDQGDRLKLRDAFPYDYDQVLDLFTKLLKRNSNDYLAL